MPLSRIEHLRYAVRRTFDNEEMSHFDQRSAPPGDDPLFSSSDIEDFRITRMIRAGRLQRPAPITVTVADANGEDNRRPKSRTTERPFGADFAGVAPGGHRRWSVRLSVNQPAADIELLLHAAGLPPSESTVPIGGRV